MATDPEHFSAVEKQTSGGERHLYAIPETETEAAVVSEVGVEGLECTSPAYWKPFVDAFVETSEEGENFNRWASFHDAIKALLECSSPEVGAALLEQLYSHENSDVRLEAAEFADYIVLQSDEDTVFRVTMDLLDFNADKQVALDTPSSILESDFIEKMPPENLKKAMAAIRTRWYERQTSLWAEVDAVRAISRARQERPGHIYGGEFDR